MTANALLQMDNRFIFDPRHPVDPITKAAVFTAVTLGFNNRFTRWQMQSSPLAREMETRLKSLSFDDADEDYGEREIGEMFAAWGIVRESRRRIYFYIVFGTVDERDYIRWKVFGKAS